MTNMGPIMTSIGLISYKAVLSESVVNLVVDFQRLFCRFRKLVLVNNTNKLEAKLDNYIRLLLSTNNVHSHDLCLYFYSRCTPPL